MEEISRRPERLTVEVRRAVFFPTGETRADFFTAGVTGRFAEAGMKLAHPAVETARMIAPSEPTKKRSLVQGCFRHPK